MEAIETLSAEEKKAMLSQLVLMLRKVGVKPSHDIRRNFDQYAPPLLPL